MKTLYIDSWDPPEKRANFFNEVNESNPDKVVLFGHQEFEYSNFENFDKLVKWNKDRNKTFYITTLSYPLESRIDIENVKVYNWIDWYFKKIFAVCLNKCKNTDINYYFNFDYYKKGLNLKKFKYFLTSLNYRAHPHRKLMIDLMAKNNLIDNNAIAWHNINVHLFETYQYRYFKEQVLQLSNNFSDDWQNHPDQYDESFVQIISESSNVVSCFSEKTVMALIYHKPFLIAGPVGLHKKLQDLGFQLYTELFDYSFDSITDEETRYQMIMDNFVKLRIEFDKDHGESLQQLIYPKLVYNFQQLVKIAFDMSTVPDVVYEYIDICNKENKNKHTYHYFVIDFLTKERANFNIV